MENGNKILGLKPYTYESANNEDVDIKMIIMPRIHKRLTILVQEYVIQKQCKSSK